VKKNFIIISIAIGIISTAIHIGIQVFSMPTIKPSLSSETFSELEEWIYHSEHVYYAERPSLGGVGRERLVCIYTSRRYDIILHRYEIGRYSFDQKVNYLVTQIFPYSIHMIANRGLMRADVSFDSVYDILVVPSEEISVVFLARAEEDGYEIYPIRIFNSRVIDVQTTKEGVINFLFSSHTESETWESLNARRN